MEQQKAMEILMDLEKSNSLTKEEKEAVSTAIGVLSWTVLGKNRLKARKEKREKDSHW